MNSVPQINWTPTIGDPSFMGWFTVAAYFITAVISFKLYLSSDQLFSDEVVKKQKTFWLLVTLIMLFLGVNKQLDLQSLLTAIGKYYAHRDGWYEDRRFFQISGIIGIISTLLIGVSVFSYKMRAILKTNSLAIAGLCFLLLFVAIRATSFHHMDIVINTAVFGVRMNWVLELFGIFLVAISAVSLLNKERKTKAHQLDL